MNPLLVISATLPDGHIPWSCCRSMNVGVGGHTTKFPGGAANRATHRELRIMDRINVEKLRAMYPEAKITFKRS